MKKICSTCKEEKDIIFFGNDKNSKDGYSNRCKECLRNKSKKIRSKDGFKEKNRKYMKIYREENKDSFEKYQKEYYNRVDIKEIRKENSKKYREENKERLKEQKELWRENNKENVRKYRYEYTKNRRLNDPLYKLSSDIGAMIRKSFLKNNFKKCNKTNEILGCSFANFKLYIESKFEPWMNWENHGKYNSEYGFGWDIDHIIELKTATTIEDVIRLNHYTNLRPLDSKINRVDRNYYEKN